VSDPLLGYDATVHQQATNTVHVAVIVNSCTTMPGCAAVLLITCNGNSSSNAKLQV
jgi:hypothetical protein